MVICSFLGKLWKRGLIFLFGLSKPWTDSFSYTDVYEPFEGQNLPILVYRGGDIVSYTDVYGPFEGQSYLSYHDIRLHAMIRKRPGDSNAIYIFPCQLFLLLCYLFNTSMMDYSLLGIYLLFTSICNLWKYYTSMCTTKWYSFENRGIFWFFGLRDFIWYATCLLVRCITFEEREKSFPTELKL